MGVDHVASGSMMRVPVGPGWNSALASNAEALKATLKNQKAARDFEALLIAPVLDALQKTFAGTDDAHTTGASDYRRLGTQALAQAISARGGIGIAELILHHLQAPKVPGGG
jgi:Rod binding domain-containing protein